MPSKLLNTEILYNMCEDPCYIILNAFLISLFSNVTRCYGIILLPRSKIHFRSLSRYNVIGIITLCPMTGNSNNSPISL